MTALQPLATPNPTRVACHALRVAALSGAVTGRGLAPRPRRQRGEPWGFVLLAFAPLAAPELALATGMVTLAGVEIIGTLGPAMPQENE